MVSRVLKLSGYRWNGNLTKLEDLTYIANTGLVVLLAWCTYLTLVVAKISNLFWSLVTSAFGSPAKLDLL